MMPGSTVSQFPTLRLLGWLVLLALPTERLAAEPLLAAIERHRHEEGRAEARWLLRQDLDVAEAVIVALQERRKDRPNHSVLQDGMELCAKIALYARAEDDDAAMRAAVGFADALLRKYSTPSGAFIEWDRNTWLDADSMWRTIPWGVAFGGFRVFEAWLVLRDEFNPDQRDYWRRSLERTGAWIYRNPVVGGYVFNAGIDLCYLLWRIGSEFGHDEWRDWALHTARMRIARDIDEDGWIHAEEGGVSGYYQLVGMRFLARFAWESRTPELVDAIRRFFDRSAVYYANNLLGWPGNFGTRIGQLHRLPAEVVLAAAAFGDARAAHLAATLGEPNWDGEPALWRAALAQRQEARVLPPVVRFPSIQGTIVREGPWTAYFGNYEKSVWARGITNLFHRDHREWVFSTLHSLAPLDRSLHNKARLDETVDWAGFPHVRVTDGERHFDSQQRITTLKTEPGPEGGVRVEWEEPLLDRGGEKGGTMRSQFRFHGSEIDLTIELRDLVGASQTDFHFLRRPNGFVRLWVGHEVADILAGRLLTTPGHFQNRRLRPGQPPLYAVQVDRTVFAFEVMEVPPSADIQLVTETPRGLHTGNVGGFRFRLSTPAEERNVVLKLRLRAINPDA